MTTASITLSISHAKRPPYVVLVSLALLFLFSTICVAQDPAEPPPNTALIINGQQISVAFFKRELEKPAYSIHMTVHPEKKETVVAAAEIN